MFARGAIVTAIPINIGMKAIPTQPIKETISGPNSAESNKGSMGEETSTGSPININCATSRKIP